MCISVPWRRTDEVVDSGYNFSHDTATSSIVRVTLVIDATVTDGAVTIEPSTEVSHARRARTKSGRRGDRG